MPVSVAPEGQAEIEGVWGTDVDAVMGKTLAAQHLGLVGMRERARSIGADLSITSTLGRGAQVSVRLPIPAAQDPREPDRRGSPEQRLSSSFAGSTSSGSRPIPASGPDS